MISVLDPSLHADVLTAIGDQSNPDVKIHRFAVVNDTKLPIPHSIIEAEVIAEIARVERGSAVMSCEIAHDPECVDASEVICTCDEVWVKLVWRTSASIQREGEPT